MGKASAKYSDVIIVAPDDPRDEKVPDINRQIREGIGSGFVEGKNLFEFEDRMEALKFAVRQAQPGDFIALTGKGHEPTLALADRELPWNEREIALQILRGK
jgi:UDP-N-acetylmuramoyl-L-alanyl-D-glutamate--2,6-diaminopimelate ligase